MMESVNRTRRAQHLVAGAAVAVDGLPDRQAVCRDRPAQHAGVPRRAGVPRSTPRPACCCSTCPPMPAPTRGCRSDLGDADGDSRLRARFVQGRRRRQPRRRARRRAERDRSNRARTRFSPASCAARRRAIVRVDVPGRARKRPPPVRPRAARRFTAMRRRSSARGRCSRPAWSRSTASVNEGGRTAMGCSPARRRAAGGRRVGVPASARAAALERYRRSPERRARHRGRRRADAAAGSSSSTGLRDPLAPRSRDARGRRRGCRPTPSRAAGRPIRRCSRTFVHRARARSAAAAAGRDARPIATACSPRRARRPSDGLWTASGWRRRSRGVRRFVYAGPTRGGAAEGASSKR